MLLFNTSVRSVLPVYTPSLAAGSGRHQEAPSDVAGDKSLSPDNERGTTVDAAKKGLTTDQERIVAQLKARDTTVRAHEAAHLAAASGLAVSGATYTYQHGPDGQSYAIGGEVNIDTSPVSGNPIATINKAEIIKRAALAPANPSGQDRKVAVAADQMAVQARIALLKSQQQQGVNSYQTVSRNVDEAKATQLDLRV